jgi:hypothetical protein
LEAGVVAEGCHWEIAGELGVDRPCLVVVRPAIKVSISLFKYDDQLISPSVALPAAFAPFEYAVSFPFPVRVSTC